MKILLLVFSLFSAITIANVANASIAEREIDKMVGEIDTQLKSMAVALAEPAVAPAPIAAVVDQTFFMNSMWYRFGVDIGIKLPLVNLKISPQFGFIFGRKNPEGWKPYQPLCENM